MTDEAAMDVAVNDEGEVGGGADDDGALASMSGCDLFNDSDMAGSVLPLPARSRSPFSNAYAGLYVAVADCGWEGS